ncbi:MAG: hypothetical protein JWQ43_3445 [Glaciihabitans sp.]|nr:hypothetical protein [Glaciihabitans sp.]
MGSDSDLPGEGGFYAPAPSDTPTYVELGTITVDGETFAVRRSEDDGSNHYDWISGPNAGYGFSISRGSEPRTNEQHSVAIHGFLAEIDPATGYL